MYEIIESQIRDFFFFFFSSRRRHTRCSRDWSSDVCSSDLLVLSPLPGARPTYCLGETVFCQTPAACAGGTAPGLPRLRWPKRNLVHSKCIAGVSRLVPIGPFERRPHQQTRAFLPQPPSF